MFVLRRHRLVTVLLALVSLLFMQLAVAGYACPVDDAGQPRAAAMNVAGMPCADEMSSAMDSEQPGLCHAHCQSTQQTVDKVQPPAPVAAMATGFAYTIEPAQPALPRRAVPFPSLLRATEPALAVRNCCFRL